MGQSIDVPDWATSVRVSVADDSGLPVRALVWGLSGSHWNGRHETSVCSGTQATFDVIRQRWSSLAVSPDAGMWVAAQNCPAVSVSTPTTGEIRATFLS